MTKVVSVENLIIKLLSGLIVTLAAAVVFTTVAASTAHAAVLSLTPSSGNIKSGDDLKVQILLETTPTDRIDGADAVLLFDSKKLKPKDVKSGQKFKNIVTKESDGKLQITALTSTKGDIFTEPVNLAEVNFTILESGVTSINFDYADNSTTDSNVVEHKSLKDLLTQANGGDYSVQATPTHQTISILKRALPFVLILVVLLLLGGGVFWFFRRGGFSAFGGRDEGVFYPDSVPLDEVPKDVELTKPEDQTISPLPNQNTGTTTPVENPQPPVSGEGS